MWPFSKSRNDLKTIPANMTLARETRWSREYQSPDRHERFVDSRFRDGSASITLEELTRDWSIWSEQEKVDFSQSFVHYEGKDRGDILRFLMRMGDHDVWSAIASSIAVTLPPEEAFPFLRKCCETCAAGSGSNYFQALWLTKSSESKQVLHRCLERIWNSPDLLKPDEFCNWVAFDAIWCIEAMIRLGEPPERFRDRFETLRAHPSMGEYTEKWLSQYFQPADGPTTGSTI